MNPPDDRRVGVSFVRGFSGRPVDCALYVATYTGTGVIVFALVDVAALLLSRRSAGS